MDTDTPSPSEPPQPEAPIEDVGELPVTFRAAHPRISLLELAMVGAGGAVGALGRVGLEQAWPTAAGGWPWATLTVNIIGAFLLASLMTALRHGPVSIPTYRLLGTGFCGALTTFSTMQLELLQMLDHARYDLALGYVGVSLVGGYAAVSLAARLTARATIGAPIEVKG